MFYECITNHYTKIKSVIKIIYYLIMFYLRHVLSNQFFFIGK
jgi:hypothetical protein